MLRPARPSGRALVFKGAMVHALLAFVFQEAWIRAVPFSGACWLRATLSQALEKRVVAHRGGLIYDAACTGIPRRLGYLGAYCALRLCVEGSRRLVVLHLFRVAAVNGILWSRRRCL